MSPNSKEGAGLPARRLDRERLRKFLLKRKPRAAITASATTTPPDQKPIVAIPPTVSNLTKRKRSDSFCENCECAKCQELKPPAKRKKLDDAPPSSAAKDFIAKMDPSFLSELKTLLDDEPMDDLPSTPSRSTTPVVVQDSPFLNLPAEIRNKIYRHALCPESPGTPLDIDATIVRYLQKPYLTQPHHLAVELLRTCKQVHQEAGSILYSENIFRGRGDALIKLVDGQGSMVPYIRQLSVIDADFRIALAGKSFEGWPALASFEDLPRLRKLDLDISEGDSAFRRAGMGSREIARGIFWALSEWIEVMKKTYNDVDIFNCIHVFPGQVTLDQDIFREEFAYFLESYSIPPKLHKEVVEEHQWRMRERFLQEVERRIKALEG